jgi:hypothetical protein
MLLQFKCGDLQAPALTLLPLLALLLNFLNFNGYSFLKWESLILIAALLVPAILTLGLAVFWRPAAYLIPSSCVVVYLDTLAPIMQQIALRERWQIMLSGTVVLLLTIVLHRIGAKARSVLVVVFAVIVLVNVAHTQQSLPLERNDPQPGFRPDTSLPLYIHLVLDAHIGLNGLPPEVPGYAAARSTMARFFERWGFRVFPAAFSHYNDSRQSLGNLVGFTETEFNFPDGIAKQNRLFEALKARGYRLRVYETDYFRYCQSEAVHVDFCFTYGYDSIRSLNSVAMPPTRKALVVAGHWLGSMHFGVVAKGLPNVILRMLVKLQLISIPPLDITFRYDASGPINAMVALERIVRDVRVNSAGTAFFAHLGIPHGPYLYAGDCTVSNDLRLWSQWYDDASRNESYELYMSQLQCIYRFLDAWMTELNEAGILDRAEIVLHGDHGSRISNDLTTYPLPHGADVEWLCALRDNFSTLFAVRSPRFMPGSDLVVKSVNRLTREFFESPGWMSHAERDDLFLFVPGLKESFEKYPISPGLFAPPSK